MSPRDDSPRFDAPRNYGDVGVVAAGRDVDTLGALGQWVSKTFAFNTAKPLLPLGYYANILPLTAELGLAISTDGVGTKILVAQEMGIYNTVGIDCVAMNANDVVCVGARPISMVDYIAVEQGRVVPVERRQCARSLCRVAAHRATPSPSESRDRHDRCDPSHSGPRQAHRRLRSGRPVAPGLPPPGSPAHRNRLPPRPPRDPAIAPATG